MAVDFKALLAKPTDSIEKPKALPGGTYTGSVGKFEFGESKEKKTPYVRFALSLASAGEDVDQDLLTGIDLSKKSLRKDFYLTPDSEYRVLEFAQSLGHDTAGKSLGEAIALCQGGTVLIEVTQRSSTDGQEIYNDVGKVVGA